MMLDSVGIYGFVLHYSLLFAFFGAAMIAFIYLWKKKRLDMDETPKYTLFEEE